MTEETAEFKPNRHASFEKLLNSLAKGKEIAPDSSLTRFSDLEEEELGLIKAIWPKIPATRRITILEDMLRLQETDTLLSFESFAQFALVDTDPHVRINAIRLLKECDDTHLIPQFINMLEQDPEPLVRAVAAEALGFFVYLGELEEISLNNQDKVEECLMRIIASKAPSAVREKALESLGYSSREGISELIQNAYNSKDIPWVCSALTAMGRSADDSWSAQILEKLRNPDPRVQVCAVRSAGELELAEARQPLIELVEDIEGLESEVVDAVIWSLSQIGGPGVRDAIEALEDALGEGEQSDFFDQVMENLDFSEQSLNLDLYDFDVSDGLVHGEPLDDE